MEYFEEEEIEAHELRKRLWKLVNNSKLSLNQHSKGMGVNGGTLTNFLKMRIENPAYHTLVKIKNYLEAQKG
jgi:hypothetical protein